MQRTLSEHITYFEEKIEAFKKQLQETGKTAQQNESRLTWESRNER